MKKIDSMNVYALKMAAVFLAIGAICAGAIFVIFGWPW